MTRRFFIMPPQFFAHYGRGRVASPAGLKPATPCLEGRCSIQLSYEDVIAICRLRLALQSVFSLRVPRKPDPTGAQPTARLAGFVESNGRTIAGWRRAASLLPVSEFFPFGSPYRDRRINQNAFEMCFPVAQTTISPPLGFFFEARSLNLTLVFALAFFLWEAMFLGGCDVAGCEPLSVRDLPMGQAIMPKAFLNTFLMNAHSTVNISCA